MSILSMSLQEAKMKLSRKEVSAEELVSAYIRSSELAQKELNIYITPTFEQALLKAKEYDTRRANGEDLDGLFGIPFAIKDAFLTKGVRTTHGSHFLEDFVAPYESTVTRKAQDAGLISLGKLNMDEFAMGSSGFHSYYGPSYNPWDKNKSPGGSSSGSSASVAARATLGALGTDTGGSVRLPASFTSTVGIKPTYGTCSRYGIIGYGSSLDQAGILSRDVTDNALILQAISGYDERDSSMIKFTTPNYSEKIGTSIKGMKIGWNEAQFTNGLTDAQKAICDKTFKILTGLGVELVPISLPYSQYAACAYYIIAFVESYSNYSRFDGIRYGKRFKGSSIKDTYKKSRAQGWQYLVRQRSLVGAYYLNYKFDNFLQVARLRRAIASEYHQVLKNVNCILSPVFYGDITTLSNEQSNDMAMLTDNATVTANLCGLPALSLPIGFSDPTSPFGGQLIGNYYDEATIYQVSYALEQELGLQNIPDFIKKHNLW